MGVTASFQPESSRAWTKSARRMATTLLMAMTVLVMPDEAHAARLDIEPITEASVPSFSLWARTGPHHPRQPSQLTSSVRDSSAHLAAAWAWLRVAPGVSLPFAACDGSAIAWAMGRRCLPPAGAPSSGCLPSNLPAQWRPPSEPHIVKCLPNTATHGRKENANVQVYRSRC